MGSLCGCVHQSIYRFAGCEVVKTEEVHEEAGTNYIPTSAGGTHGHAQDLPQASHLLRTNRPHLLGASEPPHHTHP